MKVQTKITEYQGLHSSHKKLADGSHRVYWYAWRGGPLLKAGDEYLQPEDPRFRGAYDAAHSGHRPEASGDLSELINRYKQSSEFTEGLGDRTRSEKDRYLQEIDGEFGKLSLAAIQSMLFRT